MLFSDTYKEIKTTTNSVYTERGSKFIAYSFPVYNELEIKNKLKNIKKHEPSANHYCYAYILHPDKSIYRINDDGEPQSTAGRQILKQIQKLELTNILIIVVRYFGGIKLGISGLIRSYKTATLLALEKSIIVIKDLEEKYAVTFEHTEMNSVMKLVKEYNLKILERDFKTNCRLIFLVPKKKSEIVLKKLKDNYKLEITYL